MKSIYFPENKTNFPYEVYLQDKSEIVAEMNGDPDKILIPSKKGVYMLHVPFLFDNFVSDKNEWVFELFDLVIFGPAFLTKLNRYGENMNHFDILLFEFSQFARSAFKNMKCNIPAYHKSVSRYVQRMDGMAYESDGEGGEGEEEEEEEESEDSELDRPFKIFTGSRQRLAMKLGMM